MPKKMSLKQIEANRENAKKSTGPKTPEGLAVSKMNALKHGILSKEVLVHGLNRRENGRDLAALHQRFWEDLNPIGITEEMLVDKIVTAQWRLGRALTAESGEIALNVDGGQHERSRVDLRLQLLQWELHGDTIREMEASAMGTGMLSRWLSELRSTVERDGELTEAAILRHAAYPGNKPNSLTWQLDQFRLKLSDNPDGLEATALRDRNKQQTLAFLDRKLAHLQWKKARCCKREEKEEEARQAAAVLPSMAVLDKIMRYETKLERQLYRALAQLERLQRRRQGEVIPPPLTVDVSERGE